MPDWDLAGNILHCDGSPLPHHVGTFFPTRKLLKSLVVTVGEHHLQRVDRQEQSILVLHVFVHPGFNRLHYMDCDVAVLRLQHPARFGKRELEGWRGLDVVKVPLVLLLILIKVTQSG